MHALVTGAGGFLGLYLAEQLVARGDRVRALCRRQHPQLDTLGIEVALADLRDAHAVIAACEGMDCIFHVAGIAGIWGPWQLFHDVNTLGTQHVIRGCKKHGVARLVYTSSPSVTFDGSPQEGVDESVPYPSRWLCHYPHTKALAEAAVLAANGSGGLATCSLRPHLIWGPRERHLVPRVIERARAGRLRRVGDGTNLVDMVYVENAAQAHLAAADALASPDAQCGGKAYFISQGEPVNCWEWINHILALANLPPVRKSISLRSAWRVGAACEVVWRMLSRRTEPPMTRFLAAQLGTSHWFDISAARRDLGYAPAVSTEEGMRRLGEWLVRSKAEPRNE
jgi:nucleoside-diphosphate-sugar epimerase